MRARLGRLARQGGGPGRPAPAPRRLAQAQDAALQVQALAAAHVLVRQRRLRHLRARLTRVTGHPSPRPALKTHRHPCAWAQAKDIPVRASFQLKSDIGF